MKLRIDQIRPSPYQVRDTYGKEDFEELKQQAEVGLIYPLLVREVEGGYEVVDGHRRLAALKAMGAESAPVTLYEADDYELASIAVEIGTRPHSEVEKGEMVWRWLEKQFAITGDGKLPTPFAFVDSYRRHGSWADLNQRCGDPLGKLKVRFGSLVSVENWLSAYKSIAPPVRQMLSKGEITSSQARHVAEGLTGRSELQERVAKKLAQEEIGGSQAVGEMTKAVRAVEDDPEALEVLLETPWVRPAQELEEEAVDKALDMRAAQRAREKAETARAKQKRYEATGKVKDFLDAAREWSKAVYVALEQVDQGKFSPEAKEFVLTRLEDIRGYEDELIEKLEGGRDA